MPRDGGCTFGWLPAGGAPELARPPRRSGHQSSPKPRRCTARRSLQGRLFTGQNGLPELVTLCSKGKEDQARLGHAQARSNPAKSRTMNLGGREPPSSDLGLDGWCSEAEQGRPPGGLAMPASSLYPGQAPPPPRHTVSSGCPSGILKQRCPPPKKKFGPGSGRATSREPWLPRGTTLGARLLGCWENLPPAPLPGWPGNPAGAGRSRGGRVLVLVLPGPPAALVLLKTDALASAPLVSLLEQPLRPRRHHSQPASQPAAGLCPPAPRHTGVHPHCALPHAQTHSGAPWKAPPQRQPAPLCKEAPGSSASPGCETHPRP